MATKGKGHQLGDRSVFSGAILTMKLILGGQTKLCCPLLLFLLMKLSFFLYARKQSSLFVQLPLNCRANLDPPTLATTHHVDIKNTRSRVM